MTRLGVRAAVFIACFVLGSAEVRAAVLQESKIEGQEEDQPAPEGRSFFSFGAELWYIDVRGSLESNRSGITDTTFSISGDAGMDHEIVPKLFIEYTPDSSHSFRLDFRRLDASGSHTLTRNVVFDGVDFPQGSAVSSDFQASWLGFEWRIHTGSESGFGFQGDSVISYRWLNSEFELSGAPGKGRQKYSIESFGYGYDMKHVFEPGIYVGGDFGVSWAFQDRFLGGEFALRAGYQADRVSAELGYRWWGLYGAYNGEPDLDLRMRGPFLAAIVRF